jgi:hypothetical protein
MEAMTLIHTTLTPMGYAAGMALNEVSVLSLNVVM